MAITLGELVKREVLRKDAMKSCEFRGHKMGEWKIVGWHKRVEQCECTECGMYVQIDPTPPPNGIDIGGTAVALNCKN